MQIVHLYLSVEDERGVDMGKERKNRHMRRLKKFTKYNHGKTEWHLLPLWVMEDVVRVLMHGARKYSPNNWQKCRDLSVYYDACLRHLNEYQKGEKIDKESGLPHLAHAVCCLMFQLGLEKITKEER